jgi:hypothetical protein
MNVQIAGQSSGVASLTVTVVDLAIFRSISAHHLRHTRSRLYRSSSGISGMPPEQWITAAIRDPTPTVMK